MFFQQTKIYIKLYHTSFVVSQKVYFLEYKKKLYDTPLDISVKLYMFFLPFGTPYLNPLSV